MKKSVSTKKIVAMTAIKKGVVKKVPSKKKCVLPGEISLGIPIDTSSVMTPKFQAINNIERANKTGKWLVAVFRVEKGQIFCDRTSINFPTDSVDKMCELFVKDAQSLKNVKQ